MGSLTGDAQTTAPIYGQAFADAMAGGAGGLDTIAHEGTFTATGADAGGATANRLLAANASRGRFEVWNFSDQILYVRLGTTAVSATSWTRQFPPGGTGMVDDKWRGEVRVFIPAAITTGQIRFSEQTV
jgi:hypothetical protein